MAVAFVPTALILLGITWRERVNRRLVRWRYRIRGEPDRDGWQARANFGREER
jgi:hypothetical protein